MSWNYAQLTQQAKRYGGPDAFIEFLVERGRKEMSTSVALAFAGGAAVGALVMRVRQSHEFGKFIRDKVVSLERNDRGERVVRIEKAPEEEDEFMDEPAAEAAEELKKQEEEINE